MGWQAADDPRPGGDPGRARACPAARRVRARRRLGAAAPSAALAAALEAAAGPDGL